MNTLCSVIKSHVYCSFCLLCIVISNRIVRFWGGACGHPHCDVIVPAESTASIACVIHSSLTRVRKQAKFSSDPYPQAI